MIGTPVVGACRRFGTPAWLCVEERVGLPHRRPPIQWRRARDRDRMRVWIDRRQDKANIYFTLEQAFRTDNQFH
jgi:hypothetical protein